ncbi:MAG: FMN-binding glutamate synthase family protein [Pirellulaceae bacterium]
MIWIIVIAIVVLIIVAVALHDLFQKKHAILRNFPLIGHGRYLIEKLGPELRQYIVSRNDEERPFSRDQRGWIYASSKKENNYSGFGTDNELERSANYLIIKHSVFPITSPLPSSPEYDPNYTLPCSKILGGHRDRKLKFRPSSVINISGMSFGSLSANAVEALNRGAAICGCLQSTGEGSISPYHDHGGELVWQLGTGYFGCRADDGGFSIERFQKTLERYPQVRAIEVKLSQGAKPGAGGLLPKKKITQEISEIRGIPMDRDCASPAAHSAFRNADELLDFVEKLADVSGRPVGIKSAVGQMEFWDELVERMSNGQRAVDFVTIDGGEGGTGAAPLAFADYVALPFKKGFSRVYRKFHDAGLHERIVFVGSGKLGFPEQALMAFALGVDMINIAREAMLSIGCIQAQSCHTNFCPSGVATQNKWLMRGLDPSLKSARAANYITTLRKEIIALCHACGVEHPALISLEHLELIDDRFGSREFADVFGYQSIRRTPQSADIDECIAIMRSGQGN